MFPYSHGAAKQHEGLSCKLPQDSMLIVTPEFFYQGSKKNKKDLNSRLIHSGMTDGIDIRHKNLLC